MAHKYELPHSPIVFELKEEALLDIGVPVNRSLSKFQPMSRDIAVFIDDAVPVQKLTPRYNKIQTIDDVPEDYLAQIRHFFEHYKDLEKGKWAKVSGWTGPEEACKAIMKGVEAYNNAK